MPGGIFFDLSVNNVSMEANILLRQGYKHFSPPPETECYRIGRHVYEGDFPMSLDEIKKEFTEQVKLRAYDDKYIDKGEEREILQLALTRGVTVDSARSALGQVCESCGYVLESSVLREVKELLEIQAGNDGKIDQKEFNDAVALAKRKTQGKKNDVAVKRMVCEIIDDNAFKIKTGMFSNWYAGVKKEIGLA
jgi:hypothetical protein